MAETMMQLGSFQFGLGTAAYQDFQRSTAYTWAAQQRFGQDDALQATGPGADTIVLRGVVYPHFRGGTGQVNAMRAMSATQEPLTLIDGRGFMMGEWVVEGVDEGGAVFGPAGVALRQEFTLKLRRFPSSSGNGLLGAIFSVAGTLPLTLPITSDLKASAIAAANTANKNAAALIPGLTSALTTVSSYANQLGAQASSVIGAVKSGINAAKTLQNAGSDVGTLLGQVKTLQNVPSVLNGLANVSGSVARATGVAGSALKQAGVDLVANTAEPAAVAAVKSSMIEVNRVTVLAATIHSTATTIIGKI